MIVVTPSGISMDSREVHPENMFAGIVRAVFDKFADFSFVQFCRIAFSYLVTESGIVIVIKPEVLHEPCRSYST